MKINFSEEEYYLFGITQWGIKLCYDFLSKGKKVTFIDNDVRKQNKEVIPGVKCIALNDIDSDGVCIVCVQKKENRESICKQLEESIITQIICVDNEFMLNYEKKIKDDIFLKALWFFKMGYELDLDNPKTFCEKIQWLKLNDRKHEYTKLVDKEKVKEFVGKKIGNEYIIPTIQVWDSIDKIDFDKLPDSFVIKCTHDSGSTILVTNKESMDKKNVICKLKKAFETNFYWWAREWAYKNVKPQIIVEPYLVNDTKESNTGLIDYKIHTFNGKAKFIQVILNRNVKEHTAEQVFYNLEWKKLSWVFEDYPLYNGEVKKPDCLDLLINFADLLSEGMRYARIDFYIVKGKIKFGEITLYPNAGLYVFRKSWTYDQDLLLGNMIQL